MTTDNVIPEELEVQPEEVKPEVTLEELQKQLAALQETSQKNETNWKEAERVKTRLGQENQGLREGQNSRDSQDNMIKALIAVMANQKNQPAEEFTEEVKTQQPDLLKQFEVISKASDDQRKLDNATGRIKSIQGRTEALKLEGDDYELVKAFAEGGQYDKAEGKLDKLEAVSTKPPEVKDDVEKQVAEKLKAELESRGLLTQDTGTPSASSMNRKAKIKAFGEGTISMEEYEKIL